MVEPQVPQPGNHVAEPSAAETLVDSASGKRASTLNEHCDSTKPKGGVPPPLASPPLSPSSLPRYIPVELQVGRRLVLCFDGTGDQFDSDNSNIVQFFSMLQKDDKTKQMVYYQAGIGTYTTPTIATPLLSKLAKTVDEMFASYLDAHVMGGYEFLMQNYQAGDKICIFGFSRGSYIARSLAGMLHKVGLLPADNVQQVPFAYKLYTKDDPAGWDQSNLFKKSFSIDVRIEFMGVWDTVDSVGLISKRLPFTASNTIVKTFRHALALDERRAKFKANLWKRQTAKERDLGLDIRQSRTEKLRELEVINGHHKEDVQKPQIGPVAPRGKGRGRGGATFWKLDTASDREMDQLETIYSHGDDKDTCVEEVWFAGCHCDIGGGSVKNGTRHSLARISLRWMIRECFKADTGIIFDTASLYIIGLDPNTIYPHVHKRPPHLLEHAKERVIEEPETWFRRIANAFTSAAAKKKAAEAKKVYHFISEEEEELRDALSPKYDQLKLARWWWVIELLPVSMTYQKGNNERVSYIGINVGKPRFIPKQHSWGVKVHRSVQLRKEAQLKNGSKYQSRANLAVVPNWID